MLVAEHARSGVIDLKAFWSRRARRLLPALVLLIPAVAVFARFYARPQHVDAIRWDALATLAYAANWRSALSSKSYWDLFSAPSPLQHTWSLAIEEQFYVVWPLVVAFVLKRRGPRGLGVLTLALAAASAAAMLALYTPDATARVYYGTDTRATGILAGALFALASSVHAPSGRTWVLDAAGAVGLVVIGAAWVRLDGQHPWLYRGGFWLTEAAAIALLACAQAGRESLVGRALSLRPLRLLGTISYGAYLWHWPVAVALTSDRVGRSGLGLEAIRFATTMTIAALSYGYLEKPIREGRGAISRSPLAAVAALAGATALVLAGTVARPVPLTLSAVMDEKWVTLAVQGEPPPRIRVAVHGDSTANSLGWTLRGLRDPGLTVLLEGDDGFNVLRHEPPAWPDRPADARVLVLGGAFLYGIHVKGKWTKACHHQWNELFELKLDTWLASAGPRAERLWVATVPYPLGPYDSEPYRQEVDCINRSIRAVSAARHVRVFELGELVCPGGTCKQEFNGVKLRPDGVHYDLEGARALARQVLDHLEQGTPKG